MEEAILRAITGLSGAPWLDNLMRLFSWLGNNGLVWIVMALLLLARRQTRRLGLVCACALLLSLLCCNLLLKNLLARPRPYEIFAWLEPLIPPLSDFSFPSGHTSSSFAAATALGSRGPKWGVPAFILAVLISFSRLYLGVHYFSDVAAGAFLGIFCGWLAQVIIGRFYNVKN